MSNLKVLVLCALLYLSIQLGLGFLLPAFYCAYEQFIEFKNDIVYILFLFIVFALRESGLLILLFFYRLSVLLSQCS